MNLDLHIHTTAYSHCSSMTPDQLMAAAAEANLDGVCITEHNRIWRPEQAEALSQKYGLAVFRGIEVTTTGGDILVFGLEEEPQGLLGPAELKRLVDSAGGIAIAAHPFRGFLLFGFGALNMDLDAAVANPTFAHVQGLEICNGLVTEEENLFATKVADAMGLLKVGGSDAHRSDAVGTCVTSFQDYIEDEKQLVTALLGGRYTVRRLK